MIQTSQLDTACGNCNQDMWIDGIIPVANGYDMWSYSCKECGHHLKMVGPRTVHSAAISERRLVERLRVLTSGLLEAGDKIASCIIRDISAVGAKISLTESESAKMPKRFKIVIHGSRLECRFIWGNAEYFGVKFR